MPDKSRILVVCEDHDQVDPVLGSLADSHEVVRVENPVRAMATLAGAPFDAVLVASGHLQEAFQIGTLLQNEHILSGMPDGVVLLDRDNSVVWCNGRLEQWSGRNDVLGANFYSVLGNPEILGPDFCPFHTAVASGSSTGTTLRLADNRFFQLHVAPVFEQGDTPSNLIVTVRDVTSEVLQQQKLAAIHKAGTELADLTPDELLDMAVENRIDLLKSNILHYTKDLLNFDVVEVRLLAQHTGRLEPLLSMGMEPEAASRVLFAQPKNNGVTGFVAATGKSYLCEDTTEDPLYLVGAKDARSSLTVPLILHDEVIGTFNVESPEPGAFSESDLQFLEIFTRDVAVALNTLELLVAEKASTAAASVEAIHSAVALPVDEILIDAINVMERYIGHEPEVVDRLRRILQNARDIKQVIQKVGQKMAPAQALPQPPEPEHDGLHEARILLVDEDDTVRAAAHDLLERYGCVLETAPDGKQAMSMARNSRYDAFIADIRLPDMTGYEFMLKLKEVVSVEPLPLILMTGFGYDPGHSIVKARQAGLKGVLYKPFRLDQLLATVEQIVGDPGPVAQV